MNIINEIYLLERIDYLIRTRATGKPSNLADRLNVSERNIYRLISELKDCGFPIKFDKTVNSYYYQEPVSVNFSITIGSKKIVEIK